MNRYTLSLESYTEEKAKAIRQNIRFWCVDFLEQPDGRIEVTTTYEFTPEFLASKGIPDDYVILPME